MGAPSHCLFQVLNGTGELVTATYSHQYQMDVWKFSNIGNRNFQNYPVVFFDGTSDEDDGAEQNYHYQNADILQIQARSADDKSIHRLQVLALEKLVGDLVLVVNANGQILTPLRPNDLTWSSLAAASDPQSPLQIGTITSDQTSLGIGLVDLSLIFTDPNELKTYLAAINAGNVSYEQSTQLSMGIQKLIGGVAAG
jgi:hypothetical protein